ncbi:MAG: hypothetical protein U0Q18_25725 [Bryobacteraceae bacterium]
MVSLVLDGVEQISESSSVLPGAFLDIPVSKGQHRYSAAAGYWDSGSPFKIYQWLDTPYTQPSGTFNITFSDATINQLLTNYGTSGYWTGADYANLIEYEYRFTSNGSFTAYLNGNTDYSGTYALVSRNPSEFTVTFTDGRYTGTFYLLGSYFLMVRNGIPVYYFYQGS